MTPDWTAQALAWLRVHTGYDAMPTCVQTEYRVSLATFLETTNAATDRAARVAALREVP